jgi:hypothetical protein
LYSLLGADSVGADDESALGSHVVVFKTLLSADWSRDQEKRWVASATLGKDRWIIDDLSLAGPSPRFLDRMFHATASGPVLAGFDFPIGVPRSYGERTGLPDFHTALREFGAGRWSKFYEVAEKPDEISVERPFYPRRSTADARQKHLIAALGVEEINQLRRRCELPTGERRMAACPLFWTLGPNQVGKAAIAGWQEIVGPAIKRGAKLWAFDGTLLSLAAEPRLVIAETYPAEAYFHIGVSFSANESKRRTTDRARRAPAIYDWALSRSISFSPAITQLVLSGCGDDQFGEDRFDALMALLGMMEGVLGRRSEGTPDDPRVRRWEGWIIGQAST